MMMVPERIVGVGLLILGMILIFRLFGLEAFEDKAAPAAAPAPAKEVPADTPPTLPPATEPTAADIASAQDNSVEGVPPATQEVASTEGPVSPAEPSKVITAPGVVRPADAGSVRPSYPAAAGLDGEAANGPFEQYVKMLVRSELSAEGKPSAAAEAFVANEEGTIENATGYVKKAFQGIFGKPADVRI
jgi:hypothetical protein